MIILGAIEVPAGLDPDDDRSIEHVRLVELGDIRLGGARLFWICGEDCRAILGPDVGALAVELRRIMGDRKIDLQNVTIADAARIESDLDRFRVPGRVGGNHVVMRHSRSASGVTGDGAGNPLDMLEHTLDAPEAAAGEHRDLRCRLSARRFVEPRWRDRARALGRRRKTSYHDASGEQQARKNRRRAEEAGRS